MSFPNVPKDPSQIPCSSISTFVGAALTLYGSNPSQAVASLGADEEYSIKQK